MPVGPGGRHLRSSTGHTRHAYLGRQKHGHGTGFTHPDPFACDTACICANEHLLGTQHHHPPIAQSHRPNTTVFSCPSPSCRPTRHTLRHTASRARRPKQTKLPWFLTQTIGTLGAIWRSHYATTEGGPSVSCLHIRGSHHTWLYATGPSPGRFIASIHTRCK